MNDEEQFKAEVLELNLEVMRDLLPEWSRHLASNLEACKRSKSLDDLPVDRPDACIVIGAGPSLRDEDLVKLRAFKDDVIVTNKSFERCWELGLKVDWVVLLDAHPVSASQFRWMEAYCA